MKSQEIFEKWETDSESRDWMIERLKAAIKDKKIPEEEAGAILNKLMADEIKCLRWFIAKMIIQMKEVEGEIEALKFQLRHKVEPGVAVAFNTCTGFGASDDKLPD